MHRAHRAHSSADGSVAQDSSAIRSAAKAAGLTFTGLLMEGVRRLTHFLAVRSEHNDATSGDDLSPDDSVGGLNLRD